VSVAIGWADIEWTLTYVGSPDTTQDDQQLDSVLIGPVSVGLNKFVFEAAAPDIHKLPKHEWIGTTVVLLQCSYRDQVFFRVGYFVRNDYTGGDLIEHPDSIAARKERQAKAHVKIMNALKSGAAMDDFEDYVRERALMENGKPEEGEEEEEEEDDEEREDQLIIEDDEDEEGGEEEEGGEDGEEDEEDEESDEEEAPGGKRPPAGKAPPPGIGGKTPPPGVGGKVKPPGVGGKMPPPSSSSSLSSSSSTTAAASSSSSHATTSSAADTNATDNSISAANSNDKKRARAPEAAEQASTSDAPKKIGGAGGVASASEEEQEPPAKRRKLSEYPDDVIEAYITYNTEDGPRWFTNVNPDLIQRNVLMEDPRVTLFPIQWGEPMGV